MERCVQQIALTVAAGSATTSFPFDVLDLSRARALRFELVISTIGTDAGDTFNFYIQSRGAAGIWADRAAFPQYLGTASDAEAYVMVIRQLESLGADGEGYEPAGSAGGSRLTAGEVVNGPFPGVYRAGVTGASNDPSTNTPGESWRAQCVLVDANSNAAMTGTLYVYALED